MDSALANIELSQRIHSIRGREVMLDSELARLYELETRALNQAIQRNKRRFPNEDFIFKLTEEEFQCLRSQSVILNTSNRGNHRKYTPTVFTEYGIAMLSSILGSDRAIEVNIALIKIFVQLKKDKLAQSNTAEQVRLLRNEFNQRLEAHSKLLFELIDQRLPCATTVSSPLRKDTLPQIFSTDKRRMTVQAIQLGVARYYGISIQDLKALTRQRSIALPRQIAMYLTRKHTNLSFKEIAFLFEKDHTTVLHACRKMEAGLKNQADLQTEIAKLSQICGFDEL